MWQQERRRLLPATVIVSSSLVSEEDITSLTFGCFFFDNQLLSYK